MNRNAVTIDAEEPTEIMTRDEIDRIAANQCESTTRASVTFGQGAGTNVTMRCLDWLGHEGLHHCQLPSAFGRDAGKLWAWYAIAPVRP